MKFIIIADVVAIVVEILELREAAEGVGEDFCIDIAVIFVDDVGDSVSIDGWNAPQRARKFERRLRDRRIPFPPGRPGPARQFWSPVHANNFL